MALKIILKLSSQRFCALKFSVFMFLVHVIHGFSSYHKGISHLQIHILCDACLYLEKLLIFVRGCILNSFL